MTRFFGRRIAVPGAGGRRVRDDRGVSLMEMVVATGLFAILFTTVATAFDTWISTARVTEDRTMALREGRLISERVGKELRMATPQPTADDPVLSEAGPYSVTLYEIVDRGGTTTTEKVRITRVPTGNVISARATISPVPSPEVTTTIGQYVVNGFNGTSMVPVFRYFDNAELEITGSMSAQMLTLAERKLVTSVRVNLYVDKDPAGFVGSSTIETEVYIRSTGYWK